MIERLLIALRLKKAIPRLGKPKALPVYRGHIPPRPMPAPAPWQRTFDATGSDSPAPVVVLIAPPVD